MEKKLTKRNMAFFVIFVVFLLALIFNVSTVTSQETTELIISTPGGFYPDSVNVAIEIPEGHSALYTLDSKDPFVYGSPVTENIEILKRNNTPSSLALNPNITLWGSSPPSETKKATILRVVELDSEGNKLNEYVHTYFIGWDPTDFEVPVFSVVINPNYLEDYEEGMYIKGKIYDDAVADGHNPLSPFTDANWNSKELRWPAYYEVYENGELGESDLVRLQTSGRWSSALAMKSFKINYKYDVGKTDYPFFGNKTTPYTTKLRFRTGSQDMDNGILMRDALTALIFENTEQEVMNARPMALFLNGEYWGAYNMREDIDNKHFSYKYNISHKDIVLLEMDGIVDEGKDNDNIPYFELRDWLNEPTTNLSDPIQYERFINEVNPNSLIDYYTCHMFVSNPDFPNDYFFWRNKNPETQIPNTSIDGRWQYFCKDLDQGMGLYPKADGTHLPEHNSVEKYLFSPEMDGWHTLFLRKAFENPEFRELFFQRSHELLNTTLKPERTNQVVNDYKALKEPEIERQIERWQKPSNLPAWDAGINQVNEWLTQRHYYYSNHINELELHYFNNTNNETNDDPVIPTIGLVRLDTDGGLDVEFLCKPENSSNDLIVDWNFEDGNSVYDVGKNVEHLYSTPGTYNVYCGSWDQEKEKFTSLTKSFEILANNNTNNETNQTEPPIEEICYESLVEIPAVCTGGTIIEESLIPGGGKRVICESGTNRLHITAWEKNDGQFFEMYKQEESGSGIEICLTEECIRIGGSGFKMSENFPICVEGIEPPTNNETNDDPVIPTIGLVRLDTDGGLNVEFLCKPENSSNDLIVDWNFGDGNSVYDVGKNVEHIYSTPGTYNVYCGAWDQEKEKFTSITKSFEILANNETNVNPVIRDESIALSQLGFHPDQSKKVIIYNSANEGNFEIITNTGNKVYEGELNKPLNSQSQVINCQGEQECLIGDFSDFNISGEYTIKIFNKSSNQFTINKNVFQENSYIFPEFFDALRQQGSSYHEDHHMSAMPSFPAMTDGSFIMTTSQTMRAVVRMSAAYETNPELFNQNVYNNDVPDIAEHIKMHVDYLMELQDYDGTLNQPLGWYYNFNCPKDYVPEIGRYNEEVDTCLIWDGTSTPDATTKALISYTSSIPVIYDAYGYEEAMRILNRAKETDNHLGLNVTDRGLHGAALFQLYDYTHESGYLERAYNLRYEVNERMDTEMTTGSELYWTEYINHKNKIMELGPYEINGKNPEEFFTEQINNNYEKVYETGENVYLEDMEGNFQRSRSMMIFAIQSIKAGNFELAESQLSWLTGMNSVDWQGDFQSKSFIFGIGKNGIQQHLRLVPADFYRLGEKYLNGKKYVPGWITGAYDSDKDGILDYNDDYESWRHTETTSHMVALSMELMAHLDKHYNNKPSLERPLLTPLEPMALMLKEELEIEPELLDEEVIEEESEEVIEDLENETSEESNTEKVIQNNESETNESLDNENDSENVEEYNGPFGLLRLDADEKDLDVELFCKPESSSDKLIVDWNFGNGEIIYDTTNHLSFSYNEEGTYTVHCGVWDEINMKYTGLSEIFEIYFENNKEPEEVLIKNNKEPEEVLNEDEKNNSIE